MATSDVLLSIDLQNVDAEQPTEYFLVYGEDGSLLGQTNLSAQQCDSSLTDFTIDMATFNTWATDFAEPAQPKLPSATRPLCPMA